MKKFNVNSFTNVLLWFITVIQIFTIINAIQSLSLYRIVTSVYIHNTLAIVFAVITMILAYVSATLENPYTIAALLITLIVRTFVKIPFGTDISYAFLLGGNCAELILDFIPLCIGLTIKPGWKAFIHSFRKDSGTSDE